MLKYVFYFLFIICFISSQTWAAPPIDNSQPTKHYLKKYNFPSDVFTFNIPVWEKVLQPYKGKPNIHYLEFGVNYGRAAIWMLENILTHETARLTGMDIFPLDFEEIYLSNLEASGLAHKSTTIKGYSQIELRKLPLNSYDIIYIDADHRAKAVLSDAALSWELLKTGGLIIFDDYEWHVGHLPKELNPNLAINSFVSCYRDVLEIVHQGSQLIVRKKYDLCDYMSMGCSKIGQYVYVWNYNYNNELYPKDNMGEPVNLSAKERTLIEKLARSTSFGQTKLFLSPSMANDPDFISLRKRLELDLSEMEILKEKGIIFRILNRLSHYFE